MPSHHEAAFFPITLNKLNDGVPTTLSDTPPIGVPVGSGDVTWAYQWDVLIQPGLTFQISKDKNVINIVPEPGACGLLSITAGLFLARSRKK